MVFIFYFLFTNALPAIREVGVIDLLFGNKWLPHRDDFGTFNIVIASILVSIGAMVFAVPLGLAAAIFIAELAPPKVQGILKPMIELLAGIPSVVFGFFVQKSTKPTNKEINVIFILNMLPPKGFEWFLLCRVMVFRSFGEFYQYKKILRFGIKGL